MELKFHTHGLSPINGTVTDSRLKSFSYKNGTIFSIDGPLLISGHLDLIITFSVPSNKWPGTKNKSFVLTPLGKESIAGELFGMKISKREESINKLKESDGYTFNHLFNASTNQVESIVAFGKKLKKTFTDKKDIGFWYRHLNPPPKSIEVDAQTMDFIGIGLQNDKWTYIVSDGEGNYRIFFDTLWGPEEFNERNYNGELIEMERIE